MKIQIRKVLKGDLNSLKTVLDSIELFPSEILEDMISDYFNNVDSEDVWLTAVVDDEPISLVYCAPEKLTKGTYNLYAIGVKSDLQAKSIGRQMVSYLETVLMEKKMRLLIVETSGGDDFSLTRKFYENLAYTKEAIIRDFWNEGDDKVIYWKKLN